LSASGAKYYTPENANHLPLSAKTVPVHQSL
jgi:hypothetical protein